MHRFLSRPICILLCVLVPAWPVSAQDGKGADRNTLVDCEYEQTLDAFFENARGVSDRAIILRVWGGLLPEYEIVIDPEIAPKSVAVWKPSKSIWGDIYSLTQAHQTLQECVAAAKKVTVSTKQIPVPEEQVRDLWRRALSLDTSIIEQQPFRDSKGQTVVVLDAPTLEVILKSGKLRLSVTDTSRTDVVSSNPTLLQWALDVERAAAYSSTPF